MTRIVSTIVRIVVALATMFVIVGLSLALFINPVWIGFEQDRTGAASLSGFRPDQVASITNGVLGDLVFGPPTFEQEVGGVPVFTDRDRSHLADARGAFVGFGVIAMAAAVVLAVAAVATRGAPWVRRSIGQGAAVLGVGVVAGGIVVALAFEPAFELFHEVLFPGGNYSFDPRTDRMVQLFPEAFFEETALAVGSVILVISIVVSLWARRPWRAT